MGKIWKNILRKVEKKGKIWKKYVQTQYLFKLLQNGQTP